ncbi:MAG: hypothetical protein Q9173_005261 [Seirophora scorigena]
MPSAKASVPHNRKRRLSEVEPETESSSQAPAKQQKLEEHRRHRTPSSFWDNLSRQWLTRRTLREFDRRTIWPAAPIPPHRTGKEHIDLAKLKRFARHGGPSLVDIRSYPDPKTPVPSNPTMDSSQSSSRKRAKTGRESGTSSSTRKTSAYDPPFEQHLIDHGIYPEGYGDDEDFEEPANIEDINRRLAQPRSSLSPSRFTREQFLDFKKKNREALTESKVMSKAFPIIAGTADIPSQENLRFTNLQDLTDGSITKAQPDFYDGARPEDLDKQIREELGPYIVPSTNTAAPCLPNFFTEGKGPDGSAPVCKLQATYDGALGARGMHELRSYVDPETVYDNNAYTITSTYHGGTGTLAMYTTHPVESTNPNHQTEYRMTQLNSYAMTGNPDSFRQGAGAWRNGIQDFTARRQENNILFVKHRLPRYTQTCLLSEHGSSASLLSSTKDIVQPEKETSLSWVQMFDESPASYGIDSWGGYVEMVPPKARLPYERVVNLENALDYISHGLFTVYYRHSILKAPTELAKTELNGLRVAKEGVTKMKATMTIGKDLSGTFKVQDNYTRSVASVRFDAGAALQTLKSDGLIKSND